MQYVTLVNRTKRNLEGTWDGRTYTAVPGKNEYPERIAEAIKRKNPIYGSDNEVTGELQYLLGIVEQGDPIDDIEQSSEVELYNRSHFKNAVPIMIVPGNTGMYSVRRSDVAANLSSDSAFVKP
jgi:hypothetical protein